jgi:hypothetical protein
MNAGLINDKVLASSLELPAATGQFSTGQPKVGVFVYPDNQSKGTFETLFLECVNTKHNIMRSSVDNLISVVDGAYPNDASVMKKLRKGSGRLKAASGIIGNLVAPEVPFGLAIQKGDWFSSPCGNEVGLTAARAFLSAFLS